MKHKLHRITPVLFILALFISLFGSGIQLSQTTNAACTALPTTLGTATFTVNVPSSGNYRFWAHAYSPSGGNDAFYMQVDQSYCQLTVGNTGISAGQFKWIDYQNGSTSNKINVSLSAGNHSFILAGLDPSVGIDKILLSADTSCVPTGDGANCTNTSSGTGTNPIVTPTSNTSTSSSTPAVTGTISLPGAANGGTVTYYLNGQKIEGGQLDTTKLNDGKYTIKRVETDTSGKSTETTQEIIVDNHKTFTERLGQILRSPWTWLIILALLLTAAYIALRKFKPEWLAKGKEWIQAKLLRRKFIRPQPVAQSTVVYVSNNSRKAPWWRGLFVLGFALVGTAALLHSLAATTSVGYHTWDGTVANGATIVSKSGAIGGKMVQFAASAPTPPPPTPPPTPPPPTGSTFPARWSVGAPGVAQYKQTDGSIPVPAGYTVLNPHDTTNKVYNIYTCGNVTLDHVYIKASIYLGTGCYGTVTITNSIIAPPAGANIRAILNNSDGAQPLTLNISNTTVRPEPVPFNGKNDALTDHMTNDCDNCTVHINRVDGSNIGGLCLCGKNTIVENSWLHDLYIAHMADPSVAHTGGVFPYGGSGPLTIRYNRLEPGYNVGTGTEVTNYWKAITAVLFTQSSGGSMLRNYQVYGNFISLGAFDIDLENGEGLVFRDNIFGPNHWGHTNSCFSNCPTFGEWTNNKVGDINGTPGATLPKPW